MNIFQIFAKYKGHLKASASQKKIENAIKYGFIFYFKQSTRDKQIRCVHGDPRICTNYVHTKGRYR